MKKNILAIVLLFMLIQGCNKKNDPTPSSPAKTPTEYLTAHLWKISGVVSDVPLDTDGNPYTPATKDIWSVLSACDKTYTLSFSSDGTGVYANIGSVCSSNDVENFTWTLSNNKITMNFIASISSTYTQTVSLVLVNDYTLKLSIQPQYDSNNVRYIQTNIFSR